jgi:hypothetical protein
MDMITFLLDLLFGIIIIGLIIITIALFFKILKTMFKVK